MTKLAFFLCFIAEFYCNHAMFVKEYYWNIHETVLWTIAQALMFPCAMYTLYILHTRTPENMDNTQLRWFCYFLTLEAAGFTAELCLDHIPN